MVYHSKDKLHCQKILTSPQEMTEIFSAKWGSLCHAIPPFLPEDWKADVLAYRRRQLMLSYTVGETAIGLWAVGDGVSDVSACGPLIMPKLQPQCMDTGVSFHKLVWNHLPLFAGETTNIYPHILTNQSTEYPFPWPRLTSTPGLQIWA